MCSPAWSWTLDLPTSASKVQRLQVCPAVLLFVCLFILLLIVHVAYRCVHLYLYALPVYSSQRLLLEYLPGSLSLLFETWSLTWSSLFELDWLEQAPKILLSLPPHSPPALVLQTGKLCPPFYLGTRDLKLGPHACTTNTSPIETSSQCQFLFFNYIQNVLKYPTCIH